MLLENTGGEIQQTVETQKILPARDAIFVFSEQTKYSVRCGIFLTLLQKYTIHCKEKIKTIIEINNFLSFRTFLSENLHDY